MMEEKNIENNDRKYFDINLIKRLLKYAKPFSLPMLFSLILLILITLLQLTRPFIIGKAIDFFINDYKTPFVMQDRKAKNTIEYKGMHLSREKISFNDRVKALIVYIDGKYYFISNIKNADILYINKFNFSKYKTNNQRVINLNLDGRNYKGELLFENDLKILRYHDLSGIINTTFLFLLTLLFSFIFNYLQIFMLQLSGQKIIFNFRLAIFEHILSLPFKFFDSNPIGRLVTRMTNDTETINEMYTTVFVNLIKDILLIISIVIFMLTINLTLSLIFFSIIPVIIITVIVFRFFARNNYRIKRMILSSINSFLSESISGMKVVQIFNIENKKFKEFDGINSDLKKNNQKEILIYSIFRPILFICYIFTICLILTFGGNYVLKGLISFGTLFMFFYYARLFFEPIQELAEQFNILQSAMASSERIFEILDEKNDVDNRADLIKLEEIKGKIEFKNVWFAYNKNEWILKNLSFSINPGENLAIVGLTGSGKTSITNLICRFYEIQKGEILIDGINIKDIDVSNLRKIIGIVMQDVYIFTGSIESNIRLKDEIITRDEIINAAKFVNANSFIEKLNQKYEEPVSENGGTLSTGQRQLLAFARTISFNPKILILDEATSNIDTETEILIQDALKNLLANRTSIVIAHRLSTIQHCNKIIVLHKGEIRETGTHQSLIEKKGIYYNLYKLNYGVE